MSLETIWWIVYGVVAIPFGYMCGREIWIHGSRDGIKPHSPGWSLFIMVIFGVSWPILVAWVTIAWVVSCLPFRKFAEIIFR